MKWAQSDGQKGIKSIKANLK